MSVHRDVSVEYFQNSTKRRCVRKLMPQFMHKIYTCQETYSDHAMRKEVEAPETVINDDGWITECPQAG